MIHFQKFWKEKINTFAYLAWVEWGNTTFSIHPRGAPYQIHFKCEILVLKLLVVERIQNRVKYLKTDLHSSNELRYCKKRSLSMCSISRFTRPYVFTSFERLKKSSTSLKKVQLASTFNDDVKVNKTQRTSIKVFSELDSLVQVTLIGS